MRLLYVTWDGPEQSYLESLFLPLLGGLARHGVEAHVLQLRYGPDALERAARKAAAAHGVGYESRRVHRRPTVLLGSVATIAAETPNVVRLARSLRADVLMPRSLLPGAIALLARPALGRTTLVFDADGLMADERVELSGWDPRGAPYLALRSIERRLLCASDGVMTRSSAAKEVLIERAGERGFGARIHVIPNGVDASVFRRRDASESRAIRARWGVPERAPWVVFSGSIGPQYMFDEALDFFARLLERRCDARLAVLTGAVDFARDALLSKGIPAGAASVARLSREGVADVLGAADLGIALRRPTFSQRAVSPIKVSEFLLAGLPVLATRGVGDLDNLLGDGRTAHLVDSATFEPEEAVDWLLRGPLVHPERTRALARALGERELRLDLAVDRLASLLRAATAARAQR